MSVPYSKTSRINIGANLRRLREGLGLSQGQLSAMLGHERQSRLCRWEMGDGTPSLPAAIALADALGVSLDELVGRNALSAQIEREHRLDILRQIEELRAQL